jgi:hypothetical protein
MRLNTSQTAAATRELVALVRQYPGVRTRELTGTPRFHGVLTLRPPQVIRLLRAAGCVAKLAGTGPRTYYTWWADEAHVTGGQ